MSLITAPIAGAYTIQHLSPESGGQYTTLGICSDRGLRESVTRVKQPITGDVLGRETPIDGIYQGGECYLDFVLQELNRDSVRRLMHPYSLDTSYALAPGLEGEVGVPGTLDSAYAGLLKCTPVPGTIANTLTGNKIRIYGLCILANRSTVERFFNSELQTCPIRLQCYPYVQASKTVWYHKASS